MVVTEQAIIVENQIPCAVNYFKKKHGCNCMEGLPYGLQYYVEDSWVTFVVGLLILLWVWAWIPAVLQKRLIILTGLSLFLALGMLQGYQPDVVDGLHEYC